MSFVDQSKGSRSTFKGNKEIDSEPFAQSALVRVTRSRSSNQVGANGCTSNLCEVEVGSKRAARKVKREAVATKFETAKKRLKNCSSKTAADEATCPVAVVPVLTLNSAANIAMPDISPDVRLRQQALLDVADELCRRLAELKFKPPVNCVYNPLEYARFPYNNFMQRYGGRPVEAVLIGMNPGPFGMCQTGIPFGDAILAKDFLGMDGEVEQPPKGHPKRPIAGFNCKRREVSGQRLWGWVRDRFKTPDAFFDRFWVINYCPLAFMEASGKNRTPNALPAAEREPLHKACDDALRKALEVLQPRFAIGIGKYAVERARACANEDVVVGDILHPSPSNPKANTVWVPTVEGQLQALGVNLP